MRWSEGMDYLYKKLKDYAGSGFYGFHMPGHKRSRALTGADLPYDIDITEIDGFDDLHHAQGLLKEAQGRAAAVYHAGETHYLINGSTVGLLSAVLGCTRRGGRILMARNCHRSVYNAVLMNELVPVYIYPEILEGTELNAQIDPKEVDRLMQEIPDIEAVVITSPTYDGVVSDIAAITDIVHKRGGVLILDEAHGAHFGFHSLFPENGNVLGADIVIHSLHKTLPALTQTALLHMNGERADRKRVRKYLHMLQSSSPSYVLMAGIDECVRMLETNAEEVFSRYAYLLSKTREQLGGLRNLRLIESGGYDPSKIVISAADCIVQNGKEIKKITGKELYSLLREKYLLQMEMAAPSYVIAMTSPADTEEGMKRLVSALFEIDGKLAKIKNDAGEHAKNSISSILAVNEQVYLPGQAEQLAENRTDIGRAEAGKILAGKAATGDAGRAGGTEYIPLTECGGRVVLEYAYVYPPGIPLTVPGERVSAGTADRLKRYRETGFCVEGTQRKGQIEVLRDG